VVYGVASILGADPPQQFRAAPPRSGLRRGAMDGGVVTLGRVAVLDGAGPGIAGVRGGRGRGVVVVIGLGGVHADGLGQFWWGRETISASYAAHG
jgi:hypothetical protein